MVHGVMTIIWMVLSFDCFVLAFLYYIEGIDKTDILI